MKCPKRGLDVERMQRYSFGYEDPRLIGYRPLTKEEWKALDKKREREEAWRNSWRGRLAIWWKVDGVYDFRILMRILIILALYGVIFKGLLAIFPDSGGGGGRGQTYIPMFIPRIGR